MSSEELLQQLKVTYISGIPAHLQEMEACILAMEDGNDYQENFEALYRKAHSLKGSGGTYGYPIITSACHQMEDFISDTLQDADNVAPHAFDNILKYIDILKDIQVLLLNKSDDFNGIEEQLRNLKGDLLPQEINGILVGPTNNMYTQFCTQVFSQANAHCTVVESGMEALQRLLHEHFDFLVTSRENVDLNGSALIAALKLNQGKGSELKTILTTSNPDLEICEAAKPDYIVLKNKSFDVSLLGTIEEIKKSR